MPIWDKTLLAVMMQWDYCLPERGESVEKRIFYSIFSKLAKRVIPFWYDAYISDLPRLQRLLIEKADEVKPDLIAFFPYTDQFSFETLDRLRERYVTYAWFGDDHWRFESYTALYSPHFTHVSTTDPWSVSKYHGIGIDPIVTDWAANPYTENIGPLKEGESFLYDVSFVGMRDEYRAWFVRLLKNKGIDVACFGHGWPGGRVSFEEMEQIFRKSRVNLNLSNSVCADIRFVLARVQNLLLYLRAPKRAEQVKARNFEIPLSGGFQLSSYSLGLERHFDIGREIAIFTSPEDCLRQIYYYLGNEDLRKDLVARSHKKVRERHTFQHRLIDILGQIWKNKPAA